MTELIYPLSDYCLIDSEARLSQFERLTLSGGEELERAVAWLANKINHGPQNSAEWSLDLDTFRDCLEFYAKPKWQEDPASFFIAPQQQPQVSKHLVHGLYDGRIVDLQFESSYQVQNPELRDDYFGCQENRKVYARYWKHEKPAKSTLVAVHGWTMGDQRINALAFQPGFFYRLGIDVVLIELPFHGRRRLSNQTSFLVPDFTFINEAIAQTISDLRQLKLYLESQGQEKVGVVGMSLGGYLSALWASLDQLSFSIPVVPMACMAEVIAEFIEHSNHHRPGVKSRIGVSDLSQLYDLHSPLNFKPKLSSHRRFIIGGLGDEIVSPRHPHMLWEHWGRPKIHWFAGGHLAQFKHSKAFKKIGQFLTSLGCA